jgi:hypothetical protein
MTLLMFWTTISVVCLYIGLIYKLRAEQAKLPENQRGRCPWSKPLLAEDFADDKEDG